MTHKTNKKQKSYSDKNKLLVSSHGHIPIVQLMEARQVYSQSYHLSWDQM